MLDQCAYDVSRGGKGTYLDVAELALSESREGPAGGGVGEEVARTVGLLEAVVLCHVPAPVVHASQHEDRLIRETFEERAEDGV